MTPMVNFVKSWDSFGAHFVLHAKLAHFAKRWALECEIFEKHFDTRRIEAYPINKA